MSDAEVAPIVSKSVDQVYTAVPLTEVVKQTIYRKYEQALLDLEVMQSYQLRTKSGKSHPVHFAAFRSSVLALCMEIKPKAKGEVWKELNSVLEKLLKNPQLLNYDGYRDLLMEIGVFLDLAGVTKITPGVVSGAGASVGRVT